jgi:hypothetical protein
VGGSSSSLRTHVFDRCPQYKIHNRRVNSTSTVGGLHNFFSPSNESKPEPITQGQIDELLLKYHISGNIPFRQVENKYLKELVSLIEINKGQAKAPGRTTLRARLSKYSKMSVDKLKEILQANTSRISLALDMWSSRSNHGFLGTLYLTNCEGSCSIYLIYNDANCFSCDGSLDQ